MPLCEVCWSICPVRDARTIVAGPCASASTIGLSFPIPQAQLDRGEYSKPSVRMRRDLVEWQRAAVNVDKRERSGDMCRLVLVGASQQFEALLLSTRRRQARPHRPRQREALSWQWSWPLGWLRVLSSHQRSWASLKFAGDERGKLAVHGYEASWDYVAEGLPS